ncbi:hypothetical protein [Paraglaciecola sp. L3A3]|uniref:hypothetical protein n=1 Tax=Paraglaciecola sp. L3A3 TaxID=2686358 RepID=UPI001E370A76|nr:hypothetical protein [Paraglaciecola sp. L3A3]
MRLIWILGYTLAFVIGSANASEKITNNQFKLHGLSSFKQGEKTILKQWVTNGVNATRATLGIYPQTLELYLYPEKSNQAVPWAHTRRDEHESVHLYVDSRFPLDKFVNDWTLYHEIAHLAIPYLGPQYRWLSEGFASYMQYQIMDKIDVLEGKLDERYQTKISPHLRWFNSDYTAAAIARRLMDNKQYPAAYWGSAYFFVLADRQLQTEKGISLTSLIGIYQECCRTKDKNISELFTSLDSLVDAKIFTELLKRYENAAAKTIYPQSFEDNHSY